MTKTFKNWKCSGIDNGLWAVGRCSRVESSLVIDMVVVEWMTSALADVVEVEFLVWMPTWLLQLWDKLADLCAAGDGCHGCGIDPAVSPHGAR